MAEDKKNVPYDLSRRSERSTEEIVPLFCFSCGRTGHNHEGCSKGRPGSGSSLDVTQSYAGGTPASVDPPSQPSGGTSCPSPSSVGIKPPRRKPSKKATKSTTHEELEKLYRTGEESRNPVGESVKLYNEQISISDPNFRDIKAESFEECGLHPDILKVLKSMQYEKPFPVQKYAMSIIQSGRNLRASACTGTGKTAAFLLPIINNILKRDIRSSKELPQRPKALIISPTRELAQQLFNDATKFTAFTDVKAKLCHGKTSVDQETQRIKSGVNILIGTLGRTVDHLRRETVALDELGYLVFDEADRIMEEDFAEEFEDFKRFLEKSGCRPQTLMFSATFADSVMSKIKSLLADHVVLRVGVQGTVNEDIDQNVVAVPEDEKREKLLEMIIAGPTDKTLVFVRSRERADMLIDYLFRNEIRANVLHGERDQYERTKALREFSDGSVSILVATWLANRGLDISLVNHVINYDLPNTMEQYINCLGRTGRVGNRGRATSFFDPRFSEDIAMAPALCRKLLEGGAPAIPEFLRVE
ncbi:uncharacterized protein LOC100904550 [Galendromus occidentalis]|uniref:RNA helicase n=1 Tax=Galendromus occidentalis TaxID=34638 RepID=A0AAJ6QR26_9ACAR|nr:uncharacterized protein LOC100904550 [Galendromus occidentalis]